jgi:uncharacterized RDD family membrane protein YckC
MQENPYRAPESLIQVPNTIAFANGRPIPAGKWRRFFNFLIDRVGAMGFGFVIGVGVGVSGWEAGLNFLLEHQIVSGLLIMIVYYVLLEGLTGRTLGKLITGTKVVNERGEPPSFAQTLGRTFSRFIPFEAFSFLGDDGRGWHDSVPGTYVVMTR